MEPNKPDTPSANFSVVLPIYTWHKLLIVLEERSMQIADYAVTSDTKQRLYEMISRQLGAAK